MSDIFQEVQEEYRREQMAKFWAKYRVAIIGAAAALIVGVAGYEGWTYWRAHQIEASSRGLDAAGQAIAVGNQKEAADALAKIAAGGAGAYAMLAQLQEAALRAEMGDVKGAVALYSAAAKSSGSPVFRDFATLRAAILICETAPFEQMKARLEPLVNGGSPWRLQASEILAYAAWRAGKKDEALKLYADIQADERAPAGIKRRALEMSALISDGMKLADIKAPVFKAPGISPSFLLPPESPTPPAPATPSTPEDPASLLGPSPAPTTPTPTP